MILLVEDEPPSGRAMALALKTAGHDVMIANSGAEALELLALHGFELVITDLVMPNLKWRQSNQHDSFKTTQNAGDPCVRLSRKGCRKGYC